MSKNRRSIGNGASSTSQFYHNNSKSGKENWVRVSRQTPCPVCGKPDNCSISRDGKASWCGRVESEKQNAGGQWFHNLSNELPAFIPPPKRPTNSVRSPQFWKDLQGKFLSHSSRAEKLKELSGRLGVSHESLDRLMVGFSDFRGEECWTFPERNPSGDIVGFRRRFADGGKRAITGSKLGLTYVKGWSDGDGPIFCPEGASDVAALLTLGLNAVGRPSNLAGIEPLAELLKTVGENRQIIILGESDKRPVTLAGHADDCECCQSCFPGLYGAKKTASDVAELLGRSVSYALPPSGSKDVREYLQSGGTGEALLSRIELVTIRPTCPIEKPKSEPHPLVGLETYRKSLPVMRVESLDNPGVYLDTSPTGAGKSFADIEALKETLSRGERSIIIEATHEACQEKVSELIRHDVEAVAYPKRDNITCQNLEECQRAESIGLSASSAVCHATCQLRERCEQSGYLKEKKRAEASDVSVMTQGRAIRYGLKNASKGRNYITIHEDPTEMVKPTMRFTLSAVSCLDDLLSACQNEAGDNEEFYDAVTHLSVVVELLRGEMSRLEKPAKELSSITHPEFCFRLPKNFESQLFRMAKFYGYADKSGVLRAVIQLVKGQVDSVGLYQAGKHSTGGKTESFTMAIFISHNPPSESSVTWFNDATGDAEYLTNLVGRPVHDKTPLGRLAMNRKAVQFPRDITQQTSPEKVVAILRGYLTDNPYQRVGIICFKKHRDIIERELGQFLGDRLNLVTHYGSGSDRGSNQFVDCDVVIVCGTLRLNPNDYRAELVRLGKFDAAGREGGWGVKRWQVQNEAGVTTILEGRGYSDPDWKRVSEMRTRAALVQAYGRARPFAGDGPDVVVFSNEECGLPVSSTGIQEMSGPLWEVVREAKSYQRNVLYKSIIGKPVDNSPSGFSCPEFAKSIGKPVSTVRETMQKLEKLGWAKKTGSKRGTRWTITAVIPADIPPNPLRESREKPSAASDFIPPEYDTRKDRPVSGRPVASERAAIQAGKPPD